MYLFWLIVTRELLIAVHMGLFATDCALMLESMPESAGLRKETQSIHQLELRPSGAGPHMPLTSCYSSIGRTRTGGAAAPSITH